MAKSHGKTAYFNIDNTAGTPGDISPYVDNIDFTQDCELAEVTGMSASSKAYIMGLYDGTLTVSGSWDDAVTVGSETVLGALAAAGGELSAGGSLTWIYGPEGSTNGDIKYTGECFMTSYGNSAPVGGRVSFSATFQRTGDISRTTFGA